MTRRSPLLLTLAIGALTALSAQARPPGLPPSEVPRTLSVQAEADIEAAPDRATLSAILRESTPWRQNAQADASTSERRQRLEARSSELLSMLERMGIPRERIDAGSLSVQGEREALPEGSGYRERLTVERAVDIELHDLTRLPEVLDALFEANVDRLTGIRYDVSDRERFEDRALTLALERAQAKAQLMASRLGVELVDVQRVEETRAPVLRPMMMAATRSDGADYSPGSISVEAGVSISWTLKDGETP